jgi:uncharacterized protein
MSESRERPGGWDGFRTFVVKKKQPESQTVTSFYLVPEDDRSLPAYRPGQFLGFRLEVPGTDTPVVRTYTLSDAPGDGRWYRLSIKREPAPLGNPAAPPGLSSNYFHDRVGVGSKLQVRAPAGDFYLRDGDRPVALLSGGVGVTPMISMLNHLVADGDGRSVWFIHGVRNGAEHAFGPHVRKLAEKHANIGVHIAYLEPRPEDRPECDYDSSGIITLDLLQRLLPGPTCDFYLCGPPPFMKALYNALLDWGATEDCIYYEFFGPATVLKANKAGAGIPPAAPAAAAATEKTAAAASLGIMVTFQRSGLTVPWDPKAGTILDLAEANGLTPAFSCRSGVCHTCMCGLIEGEVEYIDEGVFRPDDPEQVLVCSSRPKTDVTIDA